jgi:hypothetical protein
VSRFPKPITDVLTLGNGDTITVRRVLTHGEYTDSLTRSVIPDPTTGDLRVDPLKAADDTIVSYLVDWTLRDDDGAVVPIRGLPPAELLDVIRNLDHDSAVEIRKAIETHQRAQKKTAATPPPAAPLSLATSR